MKAIKKILSALLIILNLIMLCGCYGGYSKEEYTSLVDELESREDALGEYEDKVYDLEKSIPYIIEYSNAENDVVRYGFGDTWVLNDFFKLSLVYNEESDWVECSLKDMENNPILYISEFNKKFENFFVGVLRSDGEFYTETGYISDGEYLLDNTEHNFSYTVYFYVTIKNETHCAIYEFSRDDFIN